MKVATRFTVSVASLLACAGEVYAASIPCEFMKDGIAVGRCSFDSATPTVACIVRFDAAQIGGCWGANYSADRLYQVSCAVGPTEAAISELTTVEPDAVAPNSSAIAQATAFVPMAKRGLLVNLQMQVASRYTISCSQ